VILREQCDVDVEKIDQNGDALMLVTVAEGVPCDMSPIDSVEQAVDNAVTSRYRIVVGRNVLTASSRVLWRGQYFEVEGEPSMHAVRGRVHHWEAIVKKYGT